jgi:long-chain fatty acid transport protein
VGRFAGLLAVLAIAGSPVAAWGAGGISLMEQGTPRNGVASAGSAAFADDASTSFFNPAGMARLDRSQLMVGSQIVKVRNRFDPDAGTRIFMGGNDGYDAGGWAMGASQYYVHRLGERWRLGASLTTPAAGGIDYKNDWLGRYYVTETTILSLNLNPAVSYRVNDWLSLGAGANVAWMTMDFTMRLPNVASIVVPTVVRNRLEAAAEGAQRPLVKRFLESAASRVPDPNPMPDGKLKLDDLDDFAAGWNLGVLLEPCESTRIGLGYRSKLEFDLDGDFDTRGVGPLMTALGLTKGSVGTEFEVPQIAHASLYHQLTEELAILLDVMWTDWSSFQYTPLDLSTTAGAGIAIPRDWKDTWRYAIGLEYRIAPRWLVQLGFSYDSSPIRSGKKALPDIPVTRVYKFATGVKFDLNENIELGVTYMYADLGSVPIDFTAIGGRLKGSYERNYLHQVGFSINWKTGKAL